MQPTQQTQATQTSSSAGMGRQGSAFRQLVAERTRFTVGMTLLFLGLYFLLPILAGYDKPLMASKVSGNVTFGYIFAFLEFVMGWVMAAVYIVRARSFDRLAAQANAEMTSADMASTSMTSAAGARLTGGRA